MLRVEFTVEPFVEGNPGPHVLAAVGAVEALGFVVEFGPFATSFVGGDDAVAHALEVLVREAYGHGASRVAVHVEKVIHDVDHVHDRDSRDTSPQSPSGDR